MQQAQTRRRLNNPENKHICDDSVKHDENGDEY
jgi:hypothetical protein